eukprot:CAMPEP_0206454472 /NCGR_PEP_ID=MMETSP0324_2-20121206/21155_1 /ASSEMBLY_ACC=CAM_ASM_000836 /TAXON_ID=2866 /ORGANISM="Crypthecodinium cohnii, Strain Seligo" /LENGTH=337 /DNA_ID=CAMNT_0053924947 /DNA_START=86 /DNA_END=1099 /DNA_ORIENTATION=+
MGRIEQSAEDLLSKRDFIYSKDEEPHAKRNREILKAHPEIKELMRPEWRTKYLVAGTVALQIFMAWLTLEWSWLPYMMAVYVVGATANHSLFLAIHELSHNLGSSTLLGNRIISIIANFPICIAYCITFKPFHMAHHRQQGEDYVDTDIPTQLEGFLITRTATCYIDHCLRKAAFMFFQIFAYALRPCLMKPELVPYGKWLAINWAVQLTFDGLMVAWLGPKALLYMLLSTFMAGSLHPCAGHFLAEHYVTNGETETYSYYGPLNVFCYNVGYHNEHHDFPNVPWSGLAKVREIAPEFYDHLPQCESWPGMIIKYIFDDTISPYSRVKRQRLSKKEE